MIKLSKLHILNILHIASDGYEASFFLFLPFIAKALNISLTQIGALGTFQGAIGMFLAIPAGYAASKFGNIRALFMAMGLYILAFILLATATTGLILIPIYILIGISFGVFHPIAFSAVAKIAGPQKRGRSIGNFTALGDLGKIGFSSAVTFIIGYLGWRNTAFLYATVGVIIFTATAAIYKINKRNNTIKAEKKHDSSQTPIKTILTNKKFLTYSIASALDGFTSAHLFVFLPFLLLDKGIEPTILGAFSAIFFLGSFFGKTLIGSLSDKLGSTNLFIAAEIIMAVIIVLLAASNTIVMIIILSAILGLLTRGTTPAVKTMVAESLTSHAEYDKGYALNSFFNGAIKMTAPIIIGYIADQYGIVTAFNFSAITVFCASFPVIFSKLAKY